jgi:hypothetical protein
MIDKIRFFQIMQCFKEETMPLQQPLPLTAEERIDLSSTNYAFFGERPPLFLFVTLPDADATGVLTEKGERQLDSKSFYRCIEKAIAAWHDAYPETRKVRNIKTIASVALKRDDTRTENAARRATELLRKRKDNFKRANRAHFQVERNMFPVLNKLLEDNIEVEERSPPFIALIISSPELIKPFSGDADEWMLPLAETEVLAATADGHLEKQHACFGSSSEGAGGRAIGDEEYLFGSKLGKPLYEREEMLDVENVGLDAKSLKDFFRKRVTRSARVKTLPDYRPSASSSFTMLSASDFGDED